MFTPSLTATQQAVPLFIKGIAQDHSIDVVFGSDPAHRRNEDGSSTVFLPMYATFTPEQIASQPNLSDMQKALQQLFFGTGLHEVGHATDTTPGFRNPGSLGGYLWNSLEDVRIDAKRQRQLAGAKRIFNEGYGRLMTMGYWKEVPSDASPIDAFTAWVLFRGRSGIADQVVFDSLALQAEGVLRSLTGDAFVDNAWLIVSKTSHAKCTEDVFHIVNELLAFLKDQSQPAPPPPPQPQPQQQDDQSDPSPQPDDGAESDSPSGSTTTSDPSDPSDPYAGSDPSAPSDDEAGSDPQGSSQPADSDDDATASDDSTNSPSSGPGSDPSVDEGDNPGSPGSDPTDGSDNGSAGSPQSASSGEDAGSSTSPSAGSQATGTDGSTPDVPASDPASSPCPSGSPSDVSRQLLDAADSDMPLDVGAVMAQVLDAVLRQAFDAGAVQVSTPRASKSAVSVVPYVGDQDTRPLTMRLRRMLEAQSTAHTDHDRRGSRIDRRLLARIPFGQRDVFVHETQARRVDTAIMVIVDRSMSMNIGGRIKIARSAALRLSLALADIPGTSVSAVAFPEVLDSRDNQVRELLPFGAQVRRHASNFLNLDAPSWASTPLCEALVYARYSLLRQPKPRKICVVITDGAPDGEGVRERPEILAMQKCGIEVIGVGIQTMDCKDLFPRFEVVQDVSGLESAMFRLLQSVLLSKKAA